MGFLQGLAGSQALGQGMQTAAGNVATGMAQNTVGAQAPVLAQQGVDQTNEKLGVQAMTPDQLDAGQTGAFTNGGHPMSDPSHPFWNLMQSVAGAGGTSGAIPTQALEDGGPVTAPDGSVIKKSTTGQLLAQGVKELGEHIFGTGAAANAAKTVDATKDRALNYQAGGVVADNSGSPTVRPAFTHGPAIPVGPNSGIVPASTEGQILTMDSGGVVPDGFVNPMGGPAPAVSGAAAGLAQGLAQGQVMGRNLYQTFREHEARGKAADYASNVVGIDSDNQDQTAQPSMLDKARNTVEDFFHHLHAGTLNDNHVPNSDAGGIPATGAAPAGAAGAPQAAGATPAPNSQAIPTSQPGPAATPAPAGTAPAPAGAAPAAAAPAGQPAAGAPNAAAAPTAQKVATGLAAQAASQDQGANAGVPQQTPEESGKPHSLTPDYWKESQKKLQDAVRSAALAGEDPQKVYESLTAMRNAHFQGQILRQLSAANTALMSGDEKSVKQALGNVNYYLPNGKGITFKNATAADATADKTGQTQPGQLLYRNPMAGLYGHQGEPDYITVTPQHLQLLGAAALNPQTVQETMLKTYSAQAQAQKEQLSAQGEFLTGKGRLAWGNAAASKAQVDQQMVPVKKYLMFATGAKNEAEAGYYNRKQDKGAGAGLGPKVTMASVQKAQQDGMNQFDNMTQGMSSTIPLSDANGLTNPAGGRSYRDPSKVPTLFKGLTPDQSAAGRALSASLASANTGTMSGGESADMAARIVRAEGSKTPPTHMDPNTKTVVRDVIYDPGKNTVHVWVGNGWKNAYIQPNVLDAGEDQGIPTGGDSGPMDDDHAPAEDSQNMSN